jgi:hypothetical protein
MAPGEGRALGVEGALGVVRCSKSAPLPSTATPADAALRDEGELTAGPATIKAAAAAAAAAA